MNDDDEARRRQIADNIARALGGHANVVVVESAKILAFNRPDHGYDPADIKALEGLKSEPRIIRNAVRCRRCDDTIESVTVHDFKSCSCGAVFVDGGHLYQRIGGEPEDWENLSEYRE